VALITGGTSGIGFSTAKLFRDEGANVIVTSKCDEGCEKDQCEHEEGFDVVKTDICKLQEIEQLVQHIQSKYGKLDILFANAGTALFKPTKEVDEMLFDHIMDTNVKGTFFTVSKCLPIMCEGSTVVLNASNVTNMGWPGGSVYAASKAAVRSLARSWTLEIPPSKTRFNVLSPGAVETRQMDRLGCSQQEIQDIRETMLSKIPAKRFAAPEEMAKIVMFLATKESSYIAGAEICADGGWTQV